MKSPKSSRVTKKLKFKILARKHWNSLIACISKPQTKLNYPAAQRDETLFDEYFGTSVADPYRWLEEPKSAKVKKFISDQNKLTSSYLQKCWEKGFIYQRLLDLYDLPKYSCPMKKGNHYYFFKSPGLKNELILYQQDALNTEARVFLNLKISSQKGTRSLHSYSFSENCETFCYSLSTCGSDWLTIHFKDVITNTDYPDILENSKFTNLTWTHDSLGIFYSRYLAQGDGTEISNTLNQKLYYHRLGTKQEEDILAAEFPENPKLGIQSTVSHCGRYLIIYPWETSGYNCFSYARIVNDNEPSPSTTDIREDLPAKTVPVVTHFKSHFEYVTNKDTVFYFVTNEGASNYHVLGIDLSRPEQKDWIVLVPERKREVLTWALVIASDKIIACHIQDCVHVLTLYSLTSGQILKNFQIELGTITCRSGKFSDQVFFFRIESILNPSKIFYVDMDDTNMEIKEIKPKQFNTEDYTEYRVFYASKDGTQIPMFIIHRKNLILNGTNFCRLYCYGGFGISTLPCFVPHRLLALDNFDCVYAIANIRGGGEYGESWHQAGMRHCKQSCFDDLIAGAEYLIKHQYTSSKKLTISGSSNGGLVVAACVNQRPDLFAAAVAVVGVMDLLRFHKFTVGFSWIREYGCSENEEDFEYLYKISPLHNIKSSDDAEIQYPAVFVVTADHDNRVVPLHSLKYTAELQYKIGSLPNQTNPLILRVDTKSGHGEGKTTRVMVRDATEIMSFLMLTCQLKAVDFIRNKTPNTSNN